MSFTVLEAEPSLNKYLYYFVSYLYFCCSKRFHKSHIAASFQVKLKENHQQIYINQWNCLAKSESFLYQSINFRECKDNQILLPCGFCYRDAQVIFSTSTELIKSVSPPSGGLPLRSSTHHHGIFWYSSLSSYQRLSGWWRNRRGLRWEGGGHEVNKRALGREHREAWDY